MTMLLAVTWAICIWAASSADGDSARQPDAKRSFYRLPQLSYDTADRGLLPDHDQYQVNTVHTALPLDYYYY